VKLDDEIIQKEFFMQIAMVQDKIVPVEQLDPAYFDRGLYFGDGVYEVLRSYNGKIFGLDEHIERLANSLAAIEITGIDVKEIRGRVQEAFDTAKVPNVKIYFHVTRGSALRSHGWDNSLKPNFFMLISDLEEDPELKAKGVAVSVYPDIRWKRCDIKSLNLLPNVLAQQDATRKGCFEAIFLNDAGFITEGSSSAFFQIFGRTVHTTPLSKSILPSITRKFVLKAAANVGLEIVEKSIMPNQLKAVDELLLGTTTKDVIPVVEFDGQTIRDGRPGKYTKQLIEEFRLFTV